MIYGIASTGIQEPGHGAVAVMGMAQCGGPGRLFRLACAPLRESLEAGRGPAATSQGGHHGLDQTDTRDIHHWIACMDGSRRRIYLALATAEPGRFAGALQEPPAPETACAQPGGSAGDHFDFLRAYRAYAWRTHPTDAQHPPLGLVRSTLG